MAAPPAFDFQPFLDQMAAQGAGDLRLPPPVFEDMQTEIVDYRPGPDREHHVGAVLVARFPVLERYHNPMGIVQGGVLAALVDNVVGPLSYLVAPPSVTAHLAMTYLSPATPDLDHLLVQARLTSRSGRQLVFDATVGTPDGRELALGRATQTIVREKGRS